MIEHTPKTVSDTLKFMTNAQISDLLCHLENYRGRFSENDRLFLFYGYNELAERKWQRMFRLGAFKGKRRNQAHSAYDVLLGCFK